LLPAHTREPVKDDAGKLTGATLDTYSVTRENEKGETVTESLPVKEAIAAIMGRQDCQHYLLPSGRSGSGDNAEFTNTANLNRSGMSAEQKSAFVSKQGLEAFKQLPE
jgi:hypothetical protein